MKQFLPSTDPGEVADQMIERRGIDAAYEVALGRAMERRRAGDRAGEEACQKVLRAIVENAENRFKRRVRSTT